MENYSRILSCEVWKKIDKLKLASEASQDNFGKIAFLTTQCEQK